MKKIGLILPLICATTIGLIIFIYIKVLPTYISSDNFTQFLQKTIKETVDADLAIKNLNLKTEFSPELFIKADEIYLSKNSEKLFATENLDIAISFSKLLQKKIVLKKVITDNIFINVNKLQKLSVKQTEQKKSDWSAEWINAQFLVKHCKIIYTPKTNVSINIKGKNIEITKERDPKNVHFDIVVDIKNKNENLTFKFNDKNSIYIKHKKLFVDNFAININGSNVYINSVSSNDKKYNLTVSSKKFDVKNIVKLLNTNLIIPNGQEILSLFKNIDGNFDFKINFHDSKINGDLIINNGNLKIIPLSNIPVTITAGKIKLNSKDIILSDFSGYYGNSKKNKLSLKGTVKDYTKTVKTEIKIKSDITNDFAKNYLSKLVNFPIEVVGNSRALITIKSIYNDVDIKWLYKVKKGDDILIAGSAMSPKNYDRVLRGDLHFENNILTIKEIDYYIAEIINRKNRPAPILNIKGNIDLTKKDLINDIGLEIPKPLPSEFLNLFIGQRFFKKGTVVGNIKVINTGKTPVLNGEITFEKVRIPSQRLSIKLGKLTTNNGLIHLDANGRFKKSDYQFNGHIKNELVFPIIVKNINLTVDNIDVERVLKSFNNTTQTTAPIDNEVTDETYSFNPNLLIVEECSLNVIKGIYKDINFGNLHAALTLNRNGILEIKSNKFDFAEGISTLKVYCDLIKQKYSIRLGAKDVNSDLIASTLLDLDKEISGKAKALLEFNSDKDLKLNGKIQFLIQDGTITKLGLIEYVLNFAALFRNPIVMISPSTIVDLINIPEGTFKSISGVLDIKDNIVKRIDIKSTSPQLSSFIIGRINLETGDSALRIYTKFSNKNKGISGFLRNLSLNSLAKKVPFNNKTEANYYASELAQLPEIEADEKDTQVFLTKVDGDIQTNNFLSSLKKIK